MPLIISPYSFLVIKILLSERVATQTIWATGHQMLCSWSHLMAVGIKGIALAYDAHIYDAVDAECQSAYSEYQTDYAQHSRIRNVWPRPS